VLEEEVEVEVVGVDLDAGLAAEEGEAVAEFEEEGFEFAQDGVFEVLFEVTVLEAEEIEDVGIAEDEIGGELVLAAEGGKFGLGDFLGFRRRWCGCSGWGRCCSRSSSAPRDRRCG
jgi:hypothetical protein